MKLWNVFPNFGFNSNCVGHGTNIPITNLISLDYDLFASADRSGQIIIWEALETGCKQAYSTLRDPSSSPRIDSLAYLGNGILASGYGDKNVNIWNIYNGSLLSQYKHADAVLSMASLNNGYLVGGSRGAPDNLKLWRVF